MNASITLPKTGIAPQNRPSQTESVLPIIPFSGTMLVLMECKAPTELPFSEPRPNMEKYLASR